MKLPKFILIEKLKLNDTFIRLKLYKFKKFLYGCV